MNSFLGKTRNIAQSKSTSQYFFVAIIILFVIQAVWIAFSFRYPMIYDESFHVDATRFYSEHISPYISTQPKYYDTYGSLSHGGATLYHYVMSFPYRLVSLFTNDFAVYIVTLRIINVAMFAFGIYLFNVLFRRMNVRQRYVNIGLLIFTLIPLTTFTAATTNYDNMMFPLGVLYVILCLEIIKSKRINTNYLMWLVILGCVTSLVKFTFLPIFAISFIFLSIYLYRKHGSKLKSKIVQSFQTNSKRQMFTISIVAFIAIGWFSSIYLYNIVAYRSLTPACEQVLNQNRCKNNSIGLRDNTALATRNTRELTGPSGFSTLWFAQMVSWSAITGGHPDGGPVVIPKPLPIIYETIFFASVIGITFLLYAWKTLFSDISWYLLVTIALFLVLIVFLQNYYTYIHLHAPYAIQPRYLLFAMPILIVMCVMAAANALANVRRVYKYTLLIVFFALMTQGGGVTTHLLISDDSWYWKSATLRSVNHNVRNLVRHLVKGV